ncbi:MAG: phytanoyl-CoA dioxygenase family protein [Gemmatimonadota bacterium]|nr:phytanoyl-CoA dioxygenase family protein [Gemmatimonadota bacterium]
MLSHEPVPDSVEEAAGAFHRDGFCIAKGLYCAEEMLNWKARIIGILEAGGHFDTEPTSTGVHVFLADVLDPFFRERMKDACVVSILNRIIGPNVEFLSVKSVYKNKFTRFGSPWHQDWYYWKGANKISVWIAMDDATPENGCLKMIAGSHLKRFKVKQVRGENGFGWRIANEEFAGCPETTLAVNRGDAVFFHDQTLHGSFPNTSGADRWSFISTYRDGSERDESTVWKHPMVVTGESVNSG